MTMPTVLSVDDCEDDCILLQRACQRGTAKFHLLIFNDGEKVIDYLSGFLSLANGDKFTMPALVLLDLNMPRKNGFEVLDWIRNQPLLRNLRVVVFTSSQSAEDISRSYDKGANGYLCKPVDFNELLEVVQAIQGSLEKTATLETLAYFKSQPKG